MIELWEKMNGDQKLLFWVVTGAGSLLGKLAWHYPKFYCKYIEEPITSAAGFALMAICGYCWYSNSFFGISDSELMQKFWYYWLWFAGPLATLWFLGRLGCLKRILRSAGDTYHN